MKKRLSTLLALCLVAALLAGCAGTPAPADPAPAPAPADPAPADPAPAPAPEAPAEPLGTVRYGIHPSTGFSKGFHMSDLEIYKKYNFDIEMTMTTGPNVFASLEAGTMDIGYLGNGMAWHYFEPNAKIQILTIDNLTNDDRLLVRKEAGLPENASNEQLYEYLPGKTMAIDLTTTPGTFLKALVTVINEGRADADKIWYEDVETAYPLKGAKEKQIKIMNTTNANITAVMEDPKVDCCVSFSAPKTVLMNSGNYVIAATFFTHLSDRITPSTWAVNKEFADNNPELVQAFVSALVEAMDYVSKEENWQDCMERASKFEQLDVSDYDPTAAYWISKADLQDYFLNADGDGYQYLRQIRASHIGGNGLTEENAKSIEEAFRGEFLLKALES